MLVQPDSGAGSDPPPPTHFLEVLRNHLPYLAADDTLRLDHRLADLGLDSMGSITLLFDLEDALGLTFPDEWLTPETFSTADSLWQAVVAIQRNASS